MAARGNATSFPLPWQDLIQQLHDGDAMETLGQSASLPRTGTELTHVVSILLNTSMGDDSEKNMSRFIHQALVRRHVVNKLIETMKRRGHRAYKHVNIDNVRRKLKDCQRMVFLQKSFVCFLPMICKTNSNRRKALPRFPCLELMKRQ